MHEKFEVAHRDIKPHNVLLRYDGKGWGGGPTPLLMDVGSAMPLRVRVGSKGERIDLEEECSKKCSGAYRAPELTSVDLGGEIGEGADVWSVGCSLFAFCFGYCPFELPKEGIMKLGILNARFFFPSSNPRCGDYSAGVKAFMERLLTREWKERGTVGEAIETTLKLLSVFDN